jgi:hypothetical protein
MAASVDSPRLRLYLDDAAAVDDLFQQALRAKGTAALTEFLDFLARFRRYSLFNGMLIRMQRPGAMAVASRRRWRERFGRAVASDAVPIILLQPFGPVQFVYDVGDTTGPPLPQHENWDPFGVNGTLPKRVWDRAVGAAKACDIRVEAIDNYGAALAGTATVVHDMNGSQTLEFSGGARFRIRINSRLELPARFATLAHEMGHIYCGHLGGDEKGRWADRSSQLTGGQCELEAEAVSWLVCRRLGLEPRSAEYLSAHVGDGDLDRISTFAITAAAHRVEARGS